MPHSPQELTETYTNRLKMSTTSMIKDLDEALERRYSPGIPFEYSDFHAYSELPVDVKRFITVLYQEAGWIVGWDTAESVTTDQRDNESYKHTVSKIILTEKIK